MVKAAQTTWPSMSPWVESRRLDAVLRVLEDCEQAADLTDFRHRTLEGMATYLGFRHTTFFVGATLTTCFTDRTALGHGIPVRAIEPYVDYFHKEDLFSRPASIHLMRQRGALSLDEFTKPRLPDAQQHYLDEFLYRAGIHAKMVTGLRIVPTTTAVMGVVETESGAFGARDLTILNIVGRHLGNLLRWHTGEEPPTPRPSTPTLSPRQAEVVALLSRGLSNAEIAMTLSIGIDTVKKHITQALKVTGCQNRTQLALAWQVGFDQAVIRPAT